MTKKQRSEYQNQIIDHKSFADLRRDQRIVDAQVSDLYKKYGDRPPAHVAKAFENLALHRTFLDRAVNVMAFDTKGNRKAYERATGKPWESRPASKKPKRGVPFGG